MTGLQDLLLAILACLMIITGSALVVGCGGPPAAAQHTLTSTARGIVELDREVSPQYASAADGCRGAAASWDEYDACLSTWNAVEAALRAAREALLAAQSAHDSWDAGADEGESWIASIPCLVSALTHTVRAVEMVGVSVPPAIDAALSLGEQFGGACD